MDKADSTAEKIGDYLVAFSQQHGDPISNLKLQKLLYYAEGWYLAIYDRSLFSEPLQAWIRGPVVYSVWRRFNAYKWKPITKKVPTPRVSAQVEAHIEELMSVYGDFAAFTLERMTHDEPPWINARNGIDAAMPSNAVISRSDMKSYFKNLASGS